MICETCESLQTADGNHNLPPFSCSKAGSKEIKNPYIQQPWCPKNKASLRYRSQNMMVQTNAREMRFVDRLTQIQLEGYLKSINLRDPAKTDFDIPILAVYAEERLKKILKVGPKTV